MTDVERAIETLVFDALAKSGTPLDALTRCTEIAQALAFETRANVNIARANGVTWEQIGVALGMTKQAAQQRFS